MMNRSLVYVVGLGPGGAQYLTAQAQTALPAAAVLCGSTDYLRTQHPGEGAGRRPLRCGAGNGKGRQDGGARLLR